MKTRRDAWTPKDDRLLAETVIRHIRKGSTQLKAFDETGDILNRTSAACGFRWNAEVRYQYENALEQAKKDRKTRKRTESSVQKKSKHTFSPPKTVIIDAEFSEDTSPKLSSLTIKDIILYLQNVPSSCDNEALLKENHTLKQKREQIIQVQQNLQNKLNILMQQQLAIKDDFEALVNVMDRARKIVIREETLNSVAPIFQVDQNGNIEIIS